MIKRLALAVTTVAILGGIASLSMQADPAAAAEPTGTKTCGCYGGSGPEPEEPGTPICMEYLYDQCTSNADCSCS